MILTDSLYTITSENKESVSYQIRLHKECAIYRAHFPEMPVTPGVCIIQIARELFEHYINTNLEITEVVNAKFLAVISPEKSNEIEVIFSKITADEKSGIYKASATFTGKSDGKDTTFARISLCFSTSQD